MSSCTAVLYSCHPVTNKYCQLYENRAITEKVRAGQRIGDAGNNTDCDGDGSSSDEERVLDSGRLLESGAVLHAMSADEGEGDGTDEETGERDLTPEGAAAATAVLDAPDD
jgi:hypothetical protein